MTQLRALCKDVDLSSDSYRFTQKPGIATYAYNPGTMRQRPADPRGSMSGQLSQGTVSARFGE